jgi:hypothetical protein
MTNYLKIVEKLPVCFLGVLLIPSILKIYRCGESYFGSERQDIYHNSQ